MASPLHGPLLHGMCAVLAGAAPAAAGAGAAQAGFAVRIELTLPAGCRSSVERAGGGARVTLTCGDNLFINVRPTLVSVAVAAPPSTPPAGPDTAAPAAPAPAADDAGSGDGQRDGVLYVLAAASDVAEMWVIF